MLLSLSPAGLPSNSVKLFFIDVKKKANQCKCGSLSGSRVLWSKYEERESIASNIEREWFHNLQSTLIAASRLSKRQHKVEQLC